ncbi:MAG: hypothetical protein RMN51_01545 [Verrucomicrobiota bacterium]|nr:hypothetical protein [Limisphaera sp.]MDW8380783.1 hypothetical protein [Verrucomicrobiota bacterium]
MMKKRFHTCQVLATGPEGCRLWRFDVRTNGLSLDRAEQFADTRALPRQQVRKDWRCLGRPRLDIAWLNPDRVFLRVVQLPTAEPAELQAMLELQLERLSPLPVAQIVWSYHALPHTPQNPQTVILVIVARDTVETHLGQLESAGFSPDRLELGILDQLAAVPITGNGVWIHAGGLGRPDWALVAWWYGGTLRNLGFLQKPLRDDRARVVRNQLLQVAWAGELEGWLNEPPEWHLVADTAIAAEWEPLLLEALQSPILVHAPPSADELASRTAQRALQSNGLPSLLPPEHASRYRQRYVDRLWMTGLGASLVAYLLIVIIYFSALGILQFQLSRLEARIAELTPQYTQASQLKARLQVLQDRQDLRFAALDCYKLVAELLPEGATIQSFDFADGRRLTLNGTCPEDRVMAVIEFSSALRKAQVRGRPLFDAQKGEPFTQRRMPNANMVSWNFTLELSRPED